MNWVECLFKYKLTVYLITIAVCLLGLFSLFFIPISPMPAVQDNHIFIILEYPGANAETVQTQVTNKVANALQGTPHIKSIMASTYTGRANIQFDLDSQQPNVLLQTQINILQAIASAGLPSNIPEPSINVSSFLTGLLVYQLTSEHLSDFEMNNFLYASILPKLTTIPGVSIDALSKDPTIHLQLSPQKLSQYGINTDSLLSRINESFESLPTGSLYLNKQAYLLGINNSINILPDFNNLIVGYQNSNDIIGNPIYLKDIATIHFSPRSLYPTSVSYFNGHPSEQFGLLTTSLANPFEVYKKSQQAIKNLSNNLPSDLNITLTFNQAKVMHDSFTEVAYTILIASLLVLLIAFAFLGRLRATLIPIITIPVCLLGATAIITALGMSLNIFTLLAFVIAVGLVVDDAIVVVENITHHIEKGMARYEAIVHGTSHIAKTIIGITATLLAVYLPITFCSGGFITFLKAFTVPLAAAVFISGIVALTLTPIMCRYLVSDQPPSRYQQWFHDLLHKIIKQYHAALNHVLNRPYLSLLFIITLIAIAGFFSLKIPKSFFPEDPNGYIAITAKSTPMDTIESLNNQLLSLSSFFDNNKTQNYSTNIQQNNTNGEISGTITIQYKNQYLHKIKQYTQEINAYLKKNKLNSMSANMGLFLSSSGDSDVRFVIYGNQTTPQINQQAERLTKLMKQSSIFSFVDNEINQPKKQLSLNIDTAHAAQYGIYQNNITSLISNYFGGYQLNNYFDIAGLTVPVVATLNNNSLTNPDILQSLEITSPINNARLLLSQFVKLNMIAKPTTISTMNGLPSVFINANLAKGYYLSDAIPYINQLMKTHAPTLNFEYKEKAQQYIDGNTQTIMIAGLGLFFIYLLLAILFNNIIDPFIILLTVPFSIVSGMLSLLIVGDSINLFSTLALITLIGLITKHGVLIVQFANQELAKGLSAMDAVMHATRDRFRPIIMTTLAMTLGALPLLLSQGMMYVARRDIGIVLIVGLLVGTLFSLFIVPLMYTLVKRAEGSYATHTSDAPTH